MIARAAELVLEQLLEADGSEVAPEEVAHKLGLNAREMYDAVEALRSAGYEINYIDRGTRHGLRLVRGPEQSLAAEVSVRLGAQALGRNLVYRDEVDSTNTLALTLAEQGAEHGTTVLAGRQTAGRGRRGRAWLSLPGQQAFVSVIVRTKLPPDRVFELTVVTAVALAEALEICGVVPEIKWPNDVEIEGRKVAGILCESAFDSSGQLKHAVIGVGVNADVTADDIPDELRGRATSLLVATGRKGLAAPVIAAFLERLEEWLVLHESMGFATVLDAWRSRATTLDCEVRALVDGKVVTGVAEDVDETGALIVVDEAGERHRIAAGEVTTLRRA